LILATGLALSLAACGGAQSRYASHLQRGQEYFAQGNLTKAGIEFRNALQIQPKAAQALYLSGRVAELRGDPRAAAGLYQAAMDAQPDLLAARVGLARVYLLGGATDRALKLVEPALAAHPDDPELLTVRAAARFRLKDSDGARADAERAVKLAPTNEQAVSLLAGMYAEAGEVRRAISLVRTAVDGAPGSRELRQVLVVLYSSAGQPHEAEAETLKLIEIQPDEVRYRVQLALLYQGEHRTGDAQRALEDAIRAQPKNDELKLALVNFQSPQEGEKSLRGFISRDPRDEELQLALGALLQRNGAIPGALEVYKGIIGRDGTGPKAIIALDRTAAIEVKQGHSDEAAKLINQVLAANPRDTDALSLRAGLELAGNDAAAAIEDLRALLRDQPRSVPVLTTLARAYWSNGQPALAEETLHKALDTAPDDPAARAQLCELLLQTNRPQEAAAMAEETLSRDPDNAVALGFLVRADVALGELDRASAEARDLSAKRPNSSVGPYLNGVVAQAQNHFEAARADYERALRLEPGAPDVLTALVDLEVQHGHAEDALTRMRALVEAEPRNAVARNLYGQLLVKTKAYPEAAVQLSQAAELSPKWLLPYLNLVSAKLGLGDVSGAVTTCEAGLKQLPGNPALMTDLSSLYEQQGRIDDAIAQAEALHARDPQLPLAAKNLAMLLVTYRADPRNLERASRLTEALPSSNDPALLDALGWVRVKSGHPSDALEVLRRAVDESPHSALYRYHLGMAQWKLGDLGQARSNLEAAVAGSARFAGAAEARAALASIRGGAT
jgi:tetratricopeptide (TPR) repeat protein